MAEHEKADQEKQEKAVRNRRVSELNSPTVSQDPVGETPMNPTIQRHAALLSRSSSEQRITIARQLQQTYGNKYAQRLIESMNVQAKLTVNPPDDQYEREADQVAEAVTKTTSVQRETKPEEEEEQVQTKLQRQAAPEEEEEQVQTKLQRQGDGSFEAGDELESSLAVHQSAGSPLSDETRDYMEPRFGADFSRVRVHTGSEAAQLNRQISAQAFTHGPDIYLGEGKYDPGSDAGRRLLAHELSHTLQQGASTMQRAPETNSVSTLVIQRGLWGKIKKGVKKVGKAVASGAKAALGGVKKGAKAVGRGVKKAAAMVWTGAKYVSKQLWTKVTGIFNRLFNWVKKLPSRVGRLFVGLWEGVKSLKPWSLSWWESLGNLSTWGDLLKWLGARIVDLAEIVGVGEIYETVADFIKFNTRPLTGAETGKAKSVFRGSIDYSLVRVDQHAAIGPAFSKRPYTSFHTINAWSDMDDPTLIHELAHVWQYEHDGAIYMPQAIHAQKWGGGYDYGGKVELNKRQAAGQGLPSFNREQQAQIAEEYYAIKTGQPAVYARGATEADYSHFTADLQA